MHPRTTASECRASLAGFLAGTGLGAWEIRLAADQLRCSTSSFQANLPGRLMHDLFNRAVQ